jgi:DNA-binding response OmpR family regulator
LTRPARTVEMRASMPPPPTVRGTETILVVEDDDAVRAVVCNILSRQGYETIGARSPEEALVLFEEHHTIRMLLSDIVTSVAFLQKPITPESLTRRVREVLDRPERTELEPLA